VFFFFFFFLTGGISSRQQRLSVAATPTFGARSQLLVGAELLEGLKYRAYQQWISCVHYRVSFIIDISNTPVKTRCSEKAIQWEHLKKHNWHIFRCMLQLLRLPGAEEFKDLF
jgi:hypothetical protein